MDKHTPANLRRYLTAYADQSDGADEFVIPSGEELAALADDALIALHEQAVGTFDALYGDGTSLSDEDVAALASLTEGIETIGAERAGREEAAAARGETAAALLARIRPADATEEVVEEEAEVKPETDATEEVVEEPVEEPEAIAASGRKAVRVPLRGTPRAVPAASKSTERTIRDVMFASGDGLGFAPGEGMDFAAAGKAIDRRIASFNLSQYENAAKAGRHIREQHSLLTLKRDFGNGLTVSSNDQDHVDEVFARAVDETRLPGGSLVASGGWCAPSETLYDLVETESRDGLYSLPEVGISRGGIQFTKGPTFAEIYADIEGFSFTEQQDIDGEYQPGATPQDPNVVGPKPCYKIDCPEFEEVRLDVDGLCLTAGLLQRRGYPEYQGRIIRGALVAHDHRMSAKLIQSVIAGSTPVALTAPQVGTAAPILTAIELQVEHYKYTGRLSRGTSLEAVFPYWVLGAIRSDLSRRLGVDLIDVPDSRILGWFRARGINPQFVYDWQNLDTVAAGAFVAWPTTVQFLLYSAGTWVRGSSDIITLDTLYDSVLLGNNDFTALFTEEGWLTAKRGHDSRIITVPIAADGATHAGVLIEHNGTPTPAV